MKDTIDAKWWGEFEIAEDECRWWTLGPLLLGIERKEREWRVGYETSAAGDATAPGTNRSVDELESSARHVFAKPGAAIRLTPALADRSVVTRPVSPLNVPPGEQAMLFVSSPVWVRIEAVGPGPGKQLADVPVARPSDTWFGRSTFEGELCYATRTHGRLRLEDVPVQPFRAVTPLEIVNESEKELKLERVSLPVPYLTLYASDSCDLWTQKLTMRCEGNAQLATVRIRESAPAQISGAVKVAPPRKQQEGRVFKRALTSLFG